MMERAREMCSRFAHRPVVSSTNPLALAAAIGSGKESGGGGGGGAGLDVIGGSGMIALPNAGGGRAIELRNDGRAIELRNDGGGGGGGGAGQHNPYLGLRLALSNDNKLMKHFDSENKEWILVTNGTKHWWFRDGHRLHSRPPR
jgi:hypothetical protein